MGRSDALKWISVLQQSGEVVVLQRCSLSEVFILLL